METTPYLSVVIPAYNESERIVRPLEVTSEYLSQKNFPYEIIIVNDGSKDNTAEVVKGLISKIPNLRFIDRKENHGKGYTVRQGMLEAKGAIRLFTDADGSTAISYFDQMKPLFDEGHDVVISTRDSKDAKGAGQELKQVWYKRLMGNMGNLYIQIMAVWGIWDTQNGFKAFRGDVAEKIFSRMTIDRWAFDVEALALAKKFKYKIGIIPVHWINAPGTTVSFMSYFRTLWEVAKIRWNLIIGRYN